MESNDSMYGGVITWSYVVTTSVGVVAMVLSSGGVLVDDIRALFAHFEGGRLHRLGQQLCCHDPGEAQMRISPYLPVSPRISPSLPISPISPHLSLSLPSLPTMQARRPKHPKAERSPPRRRPIRRQPIRRCTRRFRWRRARRCRPHRRLPHRRRCPLSSRLR